MTYEDINNYIGTESTGIAKGYDFSLLQKFYSLEQLKEIVASDLVFFKTIETNLLADTRPKEGEYVEYAKNQYARISNASETIQLSNKIGVFVWENGTQASGCIWDPDLDHLGSLSKSMLLATPETKKGRCWTFSGNLSGPHRGVYFEIDFRVWSLVDRRGDSND